MPQVRIHGARRRRYETVEGQARGRSTANRVYTRAHRPRAQPGRGQGEEEHPQVRDHQEEGQAQGPDALLAASSPCSSGPASRSSRRSRSSTRRSTTRCFQKALAEMADSLQGGDTFADRGRAASRGLPELLRRRPALGRADRQPRRRRSTSSPTTSSATSRPSAKITVGARLPGGDHASCRSSPCSC